MGGGFINGWMQDLVNGFEENIWFTVSHRYDFKEVLHPGSSEHTPVATEVIGPNLSVNC